MAELPFGELEAVLSFSWTFSSAVGVCTNVEKCFDEGARARAAMGCAGAAGDVAVAAVVAVVVEVVLELLELARKRDCEWFEK